MKKIKIIRNTSKKASKIPLINIITRTSSRPNYFEKNHKSIVDQTYKNWKHWVIYDDKFTYNEYVKYYNDIIPIYVDKNLLDKRDKSINPNTGPRFIYNLYFNEVFRKINEGWILILDDDDTLSNVNSLRRMVDLAKYQNDMLIFQMEYLNGRKLPNNSHFYKKPVLGSIGSPCVLVHNSIAKRHIWDGWKCADYRYINKCWNLSSKKVWIKEALIKIGSMNGNLGNKNDISVKKTEKKEIYDVIFAIPTYNRPKLFKNLIDKLQSEQTSVKYLIYVIDDGSNKMIENKKFCSTKNNVFYECNEKNNGKKKYWKTFNKILSFSEKYVFDHLVQIDDDFLICNNFIKKIFKLSQDNPKKFIRYINTGSSKVRWNTENWVDGGSMIPYSFLKKIRFRINPIPMSRWAYNKNLSSGVWHQITDKLVSHKYETIHLENSLVKHMGYKDSRMNTKIRSKRYIKEKNFIDEK